ncbi:ribosome maturation factor RimP [Deltaproteobacteria bacterium OttesenSCG-928-K17]|nr:ribosome maturation factor RimP [Deltaproteobacteria bacterium OttesenSCG-928-K17]
MTNSANSSKKYNKKDCRPEQAPPPPKALLRSFTDRATELAGPVLDALGLELVLAQCHIDGGRPVLRLFIDHAASESGLDVPPAAEGPGSGVTLDDCAAASRALDAALEEDGENGAPQPDGYVLEVSSPGLDRPLVKEADFNRFQGRRIKLKLRVDGKNSSVSGRLTKTEGGALALETAEGLRVFEYGQVTSARLSLDDIFQDVGKRNEQ